MEKLKVYLTKDADGIVKAFYGKRPKLNTNGIHGNFWEIPLSEWDGTCHFDIISETGAYYFSNVLLKLFGNVIKNLPTDKPTIFTLKAYGK